MSLAKLDEKTIAIVLNELLQNIGISINQYKYLLNDFEYPARSWSDEDVFNSFNGSALTDDPVYDNKKELSIYLRGRLDGEYHIAQNILGNLEKYTEWEVSEEWLAEYHARQEEFWQSLMLKDLQRIWDELGANGTDDAIAKMKKLTSS